MPAHRTARPHRSLAGFTLIELVVTMAVVGILAAIAIPSYRNYVLKSHIKGAGADLVALALVMENQHQLTLSYPSGTNITSATTNFSAFGPVESALFTYSVTLVGTTGYQLTAAGKSTGMAKNCTLQLTNANARSFTLGSGTSACAGLTTW